MSQFAQIITALIRDAGLTEKQIGDCVGRSQPEIHRIKRGQRRRVPYEVGTALISLYTERLPGSPLPGEASR